MRDAFHSQFDDLSVSFDSGLTGIASRPAFHFLSPSTTGFAHALDLGTHAAPALSVNTLHTHALAVNDPPLSPTMADEVSFLSGINDAGEVIGTSFWTWRGNNPATYKNNSDAGKFGADHATDTDSVTVHYFFNSKAHFTATEQGVFQQCMALWSAVTNVHFEEAASQAQADLVLKRGHDGSAYEFDSDNDSGGAGTIGGTTLFTRDVATISIDTSIDGFGPIDGDFTTFGGYVWQTIIHEMGHALGLGHGGAYNGNVNELTQQFSAFDNRAWTLMSYIDPYKAAKYSGDYTFTTDWGFSPDGTHNRPVTMMPLDILAVQQLYGTPVDSPLGGGQVFGFNSNIAGDLHNFFDFTINVNPVMTIFDTGTGNTLDLSGFTKDAVVDLHPGTFSSCDGKTNNIAIAFDTTIETAIGGKGNDTFVGTDLANTLVGNNGNDTFTGGLGGDSLNGGKGNDVFHYTAAAESTGTEFDAVVGFSFASADHFDFGHVVLAIDHKVTHGGLSNDTFDTDLANAIDAAHLGAGDAVVFKPSSGDYGGAIFLVVDGNNAAGYQAGEDFVVMLDAAKKIGAIDVTDFLGT